MKPLFILGVGAQKAGTSWLHKQLNKSEFVDMGRLKEYHVWDSLYADFGNKKGKPKFFKRKVSREFVDGLMNEKGKYEEYFLSLIRNEIKITGDITPTYSLLPASAFSEIKQRIISSGFDIKVIFLMREPVERAWSAWRMKNDNLLSEGKAHTDENYENMFKKFCRGNAFRRTQYDRTIINLKKSFDENEIYINFYENLFKNETIEDISSFLDIDLSFANINEYVNKSTARKLPNELKKECKTIFKNVYEFCEIEYPITNKIW